MTLVELSSGTRQTVRLILSAGILLALAWLCRGRLRNSGGNLPDGQPLAFAAEVALVQIAMLLMSGFSWKAHFVALLLPYCVLLAWLADARYAGPRRLVGGLLLASFALCTLTGDVLGPTTADYAEAYGLIALGAILAAVGVSIVRVRCRKGISSASPTACSHTAV